MRAKSTLSKLFFFLTGVPNLLSCSVSSLDPYLRITMRGSNTAVEGATGDQSPQYQVYTLSSISANIDAKDVSLWKAADYPDDKEFTIIEREQELASIAIKDYAGKVFTSVSFTFDGGIEAAAKGGSPITAELTTATITYDTPLTLAEGRNYTLTLTADWGNTIANSTLEQPAISVSLE
jgi:hypothetical protein